MLTISSPVNCCTWHCCWLGLQEFYRFIKSFKNASQEFAQIDVPDRDNETLFRKPPNEVTIFSWNQSILGSRRTDTILGIWKDWTRNNQWNLTFGGLLIVYIIVFKERINISSLYCWDLISPEAEPPIFAYAGSLK